MADKYNKGTWYGASDFKDFRSWCKKNNKPFFAFYTNEAGGCTYCTAWNNVCLSKTKFKDWQADSNLYYCKYNGGSSDAIYNALTADTGTSVAREYPFGYFYKNATTWDVFSRPTDSNGNANQPTQKGYYIDTPNKLITQLKKYEYVSYVVTFKDWNGAVLKTQEVDKGKDAIPPSNPTRDGYEFTGWDNAFTNVQTDVICIAQYSQTQPETDQGKLIIETFCFGAEHDVELQCSDGKSVYYLYPENKLLKSLDVKITFDGNGSTSGTIDDLQLAVRDRWTCPANPFKKTKYVFASWNSHVDGSGIAYTPGQAYDAPIEDLKLFAQWKSA